jgi:hypothetical protein
MAKAENSSNEEPPPEEARRRISQAPPPPAQGLAEFTRFQKAERSCNAAILKGKNPQAVDQMRWALEVKLWSEVLRPELGETFTKCERAGMHADELEELRARIKKLDTEWGLVCEYRNNISSKGATPTVDPFKTGASGRPKATHFVVAEAERLIARGEIVPRQGGLEKASQELAAWWEEKRRSYGGPPLTAGSIKNCIRPVWSRALSDAQNRRTKL